MMKTNIKLSLAALAGIAALLLGSCEDYVEVPVPDAQLGSALVFSDVNTAEAAVVDLYARLRTNTLLCGDTNGLSILLGTAADELGYYSTGLGAEQAFNANALLATTPSVRALWNNAYGVVYASNAVMRGLDNAVAIPGAERDVFRGEALFVRALVHFYLLELYGEVPYVTTTDYRINVTIGKMGPAELYPLLIADLEEAASLLPEAYRGMGRARANRAAALALLARLHLYAGNMDQAATAASEVIGNTTLYQLDTDLDAVFLNSSSGTVLQFAPLGNGTNTLEAINFIFGTAPPPNRAISPSLAAAFEPGDLRAVHWLGSVTDGSQTWYYPFKYKQQANTGATQEQSVVLRLEELYLIRAEARAELGDLDGARADLDIIRQRAGLPPTTATTVDEVVQAVVRERRVELFTEHGHRWFDLKRKGLSDAVLGIVKPGWDPTDVLLPLPEAELLLNPNLLPQNPGY